MYCVTEYHYSLDVSPYMYMLLCVYERAREKKGFACFVDFKNALIPYGMMDQAALGTKYTTS